MRILLIGPPGVGKGTQSKFICSNYNLSHISTGDILRKQIEENTDIGKIAVTYNINKGNFVPDDIINSLIKNMFDNGFLSDFYLLDGYPRNINQAVFFNDIILNKCDKYMVIYLNADKEYILNRILWRRICLSCGNVYNLKKDVLFKEGICNNCGGKLVQRPDDNYDIFDKRFKLFHELAIDMVKYFRELNVLFEINASDEKDEVFYKIKKIIGENYDQY